MFWLELWELTLARRVYHLPAGAGAPVKQATRWMAPALPVFAAKAAPTGIWARPRLAWTWLFRATKTKPLPACADRGFAK
ncbi:hypothetical protein D8767_25895 [Pseudomonas sp. LTGT-11-2Z]|nr:hypothetical protein D8767_25895 [Pseudomonas sp. LTGT-11-2Z]